MKTVVKLEKSKIDKIAKPLDDNKVVVIKNFYNKKLCKLIVNHLKSIASGSMTSYHPIKINSPNFYRVNFDDKRSYVKGFFHQFSYFPWNQDQLNLFNIFEDAFILKNRINKIEDKRFFNPVDNSDCTVRLSFQFYPSSKGYLDQHSDPIDYHQKYLFMLSLSTIGKDFFKGGLFTKISNKTIYLDKYASTGDLIIFKANKPHGVKIIDKNKKYNPLSFNGRWMVIFSTNKLIENKSVRDSKKV